MPKRSTEFYLIDILIAIHKIFDYTSSYSDGDALQCDSRSYDATMRELEIIGEAANRLLKDPSMSELFPKYFRQVVNFRNLITHEYFGVDMDEVWDIIQNKLIPLRQDIINIVLNYDKNEITTVIKAAIKDNEKIRHTDVVRYLHSILADLS